MIVSDRLALLVPVVVTDHTLTAKGGPLHKLVPVFRNIRRGVDGPPKLRIADEIEQEDGAHHTAKLAERPVQLVLPAIRPELPQHRRRANFALTAGDRHPQHVGHVGCDQCPIDGTAKEFSVVCHWSKLAWQNMASLLAVVGLCTPHNMPEGGKPITYFSKNLPL